VALRWQWLGGMMPPRPQPAAPLRRQRVAAA
jgi:hypothetical protein